MTHSRSRKSAEDRAHDFLPVVAGLFFLCLAVILFTCKFVVSGLVASVAGICGLSLPLWRSGVGQEGCVDNFEKDERLHSKEDAIQKFKQWKGVASGFIYQDESGSWSCCSDNSQLALDLLSGRAKVKTFEAISKTLNGVGQ